MYFYYGPVLAITLSLPQITNTIYCFIHDKQGFYLKMLFCKNVLFPMQSSDKKALKHTLCTLIIVNSYKISVTVETSLHFLL